MDPAASLFDIMEDAKRRIIMDMLESADGIRPKPPNAPRPRSHAESENQSG